MMNWRVVGALVLLVGGLLVVPQREETVRPHPRLLVTAAGLERLRQLVALNEKAQALYQQLKTQADDILLQPPSRYLKPDGTRLLPISQQVLRRIYTLALVYRLDGDARYLDRAWRELQAAANFPDWNPNHFLDTAEMTHAFAIGYDWLFDAWTDEQRGVVRQALVAKGLQVAWDGYRNNQPYGLFARVDTNWNQVGNGGIGMGALAVLDEVPDLSRGLLEDAIKWLPTAMDRYEPDGVWHEGLDYWNYGTLYNVVFLAALETAEVSDGGLSKKPGFADTGLFPIYLTGPTGRLFNFGDTQDRVIQPPQMLWLAAKFSRPVYAWYAQTREAPHPLDLIWFGAPGQDPLAAALPLDKYFKDYEVKGIVTRGVEVASFRTAWNDPKALFVAVKAGENWSSHAHLDMGSFVLDALGYRWAVDLGPDDYTLPGYLSQWRYYRKRAEGHNTLVINPTPEPDQDKTDWQAVAKITRYQSKPDNAFAVVDMTPGYVRTARKVERGMAMLDRRMVVVQDEVTTKQPSDVWWFMHTPATVEISADGKTAMLRQGEARLWCAMASPPEAQFRVMEARPLPSSPNPKGQATNQGIHKLAVVLPNAESVRLTVVMVPLSQGQSLPEQLPAVKPLAEWGK